MPFDLGVTARLTAECRDPGGTLTDATTVTVTVTSPDGTAATPAVTNPPEQTGQYHADYVTEQPGRHTVRWVFTGPAYASTDVLDVRPEQAPGILSLKDAKQHLNLSLADTSEDDEIRFWNNATTTAVEYFTGPVVVRTVTEDHDAGVAVIHWLSWVGLARRAVDRNQPETFQNDTEAPVGGTLIHPAGRLVVNHQNMPFYRMRFGRPEAVQGAVGDVGYKAFGA